MHTVYMNKHNILRLYMQECVSFKQRHKVNGSVKLRYWQQVWQLHVKGVAMVTGHSQLSHPLPPSLSLSLYLFHTLFSLQDIWSHTRGRLLYHCGGPVDKSVGAELSETVKERHAARH